jgi:hypothetical protein
MTGGDAPGRCEPTGRFEHLSGRRFYRIDGYDRLEPFLMTLASSSDVWCFLSSTGGITAGRVDADHALFPYDTDDKVADSSHCTGGVTLVRVAGPHQRHQPWAPFGRTRDERAERALLKDVLGTTAVFEEARPDLGLAVQVEWTASHRFGLVRKVRLTNRSSEPVAVEVLDGLRNVLPPGVTVDTQRRLSTLIDAYKRTGADAETGLGLVYLSSRLTDLAEPSEALTASVVWQVGLSDVQHVLSAKQVDLFEQGLPVQPEVETRGERGAYLLTAARVLEPGETLRWHVVADVDKDAAAVVALRSLLSNPAAALEALEDDLARTRSALHDRLAAADALQVGGDEAATAHHLANVLFNVMRGGVPASGHAIDGGDVARFVQERSPRTAERRRGTLDGLDATVIPERLASWARDSGDPDLERLCTEYLPLTFSRRHGDPSRPWNRFRVEVQDEDGRPRLGFEGNWRDIFQNWEATALSFPAFLPSMITVFLDATTADGYNPYRISRAGVDWEVPDPDDPWANIGYWSDHQIIYLLRLLEMSEQVSPGHLATLLNRAIFTYADVPYRLASYRETVRDPVETVSYDEDRAAAVAKRQQTEGADGRLLHDVAGDLVRVGLGEKLLVPLLAKLVNLVPDGGIWMNTQRPEWNDANNALVGRGLSVVTMAYLRRYLAFLHRLLDRDIEVRAEVAGLAREVSAALHDHADALGSGFTPARRAQLMDALGEAGSRYRSRVYAGVHGATETVGRDDVGDLVQVASRFVDRTLAANARGDGLYHSYNLLDREAAGARVARLPLMLEGQVAMLSSGMLDSQAALTLLRSLRSSALFRSDQHSYLLYPDKQLPGFLARNTMPASMAAEIPLLPSLVEHGDRSLVVRDVEGDFHFAGGLRQAKDVAAALDRLRDHPRLGPAVAAGADALLELFEDVFNHAEFTGRAGSFFAYEGLGSIYWHMVSKLQLAVLETIDTALDEGASPATVDALVAAYRDVRAGLGYRRDPASYGAFPTDPYSHTPTDHGARQPGMTGQVKEEILARFRELGLVVRDGRIAFRDPLVEPDEAVTRRQSFPYLDVCGRTRELVVPPGALAFTFAQVPIRLRLGESRSVVAHTASGLVTCPDSALPIDVSRSVFRREGLVELIDVTAAALGVASRPARDLRLASDGPG